jgi:hypothetical protein
MHVEFLLGGKDMLMHCLKMTSPWRLEQMGLLIFGRKLLPLDGCSLGTRMSWFMERDLLMVSPQFLAQHELNYLELRHQTCYYFTSWYSTRSSPRASAWCALTIKQRSHG